MSSIRGAYPIESINELNKNNCDKYQLILIELNEKLKRIKEKEALIKAKEKLQAMESELPLIIKSFKDVGLDSLKCEELQDN